MNTPPEIIAHRGYSARYRENSLPAWLAAIKAGADMIEVDVRRTRDGVFVYAHDPDLRLAADARLIMETDHEEIDRIQVHGEPVAPKLFSAIHALPDNIPLLLDIKDERPESLEALLEICLANEDRFVFGLHSLESLKLVRRRSSVRILGLLNGEPKEDDAFFALGGTILRLWESMADADRIRRLREARHPIWMTTGGWGTGRDVGDFEPAGLQAHAAAGISGFLVNDPVLARKALHA